MSDDTKPDKNVVNTVFDALETPGNVTRQMLVESLNLVKGDGFDGEKVVDNAFKRSKQTPDKFLKYLSEETGLPERALGGIAGGIAGGAVSGLNPFAVMAGTLIGGTSDFGANLATDFMTDPIGFIAKPFKLLKGAKEGGKVARVARKSKALKAIGQADKVADTAVDIGRASTNLMKDYGKYTNRLAKSDKFHTRIAGETLKIIGPNDTDDLARMSTGALLGVMSIDENDDIIDSMKKVAGFSVAGKYSAKGLDGAINGFEVPKYVPLFGGSRTGGLNSLMRGAQGAYIRARQSKKLDDFKDSLIEDYGVDQGEKLYNSIDFGTLYETALKTQKSDSFLNAKQTYLDLEEALERDVMKKFQLDSKRSVESGSFKQDAVDFVERQSNYYHKRGLLKTDQEIVDAVKDMVNKGEISEGLADKHLRKMRKEYGIDQFKRRQLKRVAKGEQEFGDAMAENFYRNKADWFEDQVSFRERRFKDLKDEFLQNEQMSKRTEDALPLTDARKHQMFQQATSESNIMMGRKLDAVASRDPEISRLMNKASENNKELVSAYNSHWKGKDPSFLPIEGFNFHTFDMNSANRMADVFRNTSEGFSRRVSDRVIAAISKSDRALAREMSANAYAGQYLSFQEKNARKLVSSFYTGDLNPVELAKKIRDRAKVLTAKGFTKDEAVKRARVEFGDDTSSKILGAYDKVLGLHKATQLAASLTWAKTNLFDNTINAYLVGGLGTAGKTFFDTTMGASGQVTGALFQKMGLERGKRIVDDMLKNNSYTKIANVLSETDPDKMYRLIDYKEGLLNLGRNSGVLGANGFTDFKSSSLDGGGMADLLRAEGRENLVKEIIKNRGSSLTDKMWELPTAKFGNYAEQTMRYITWVENMKAIARSEYSDTSRAVALRLRKGEKKNKWGHNVGEYEKMSISELLEKDPEAFSKLANDTEGFDIQKIIRSESDSADSIVPYTLQELEAGFNAKNSMTPFMAKNTRSAKISKNQIARFDSFMKKASPKEKKVLEMHMNRENIISKRTDDLYKKSVTDAYFRGSTLGKSKDDVRDIVERRFDREFEALNETADSKSYRMAVRDAKRIVNESSDVINKIFFDYENVSHFEKAVAKRVFPYWTFFTRNIKKQADILFDPQYFDRVARSTKLVDNMGRPLSEEDQEEIPRFFIDKRAKLVGERPDGTKHVRFSPSFAMIDFLNSADPNVFVEEIGGKVSPIIKSPYELITGEDLFRKQQLIPRDGKPVRVFDNGLTMFMSDKTLGLFGAKRMEDGRIMTDKAGLPFFFKGMQTGLTIPPILDQFARVERDYKKKNATAQDILEEFLAPFKGSRVSEGAQDFRRKQVERLEKRKEQTLEEKLERGGGGHGRRQGPSRKRRKIRRRR